MRKKILCLIINLIFLISIIPIQASIDISTNNEKEISIVNNYLDDGLLEEKNGNRKEVQKKLFPGYVLINMEMNDETWYVVRNTRGVTGFVGPGSKPVPLSEEEIKAMGIDLEIVKIDVEIGDSVRVSDGPFEGSVGVVKEIHEHKRTVIVNLSIFGRETPVELDFTQVEKI